MNENNNERKKIEEKLRESEIKYRTLFEHAADTIFLVDPETGELVEFNNKAYENIGYTRDEFKKLKISDFEVIETTEEVNKHIEKILRDGFDTFETKHRTKQGEIRNILVSSTVLLIRGKRFIQSICRDITENKNAEMKILESEKRLKDLMEAVPIGISISNLEGKISEVNSHAVNLFGYNTKEEFLNVPAQVHYYNPKDREKFVNLLEKGIVKDFEVQFKRKDGTMFWGALTSVTQTIGDKTIFVNTFQDIDERKKAEEKIHYQAKLVENVSDAILSLDIDFNIISWNKAAEKIYGWKSDEVIGKNLSDVIPVEFPKDKREDVLKDFFEKGYWECEGIQYHKNGKPINILSSSTIIKDVNGKPTDIVTINRDITKRKKAEVKIIKEREKAELYLNLVNVILVALDRVGIITLLNKKGYEILEYEEGELIGKNWFETCLPPHDRERVYDYFKKLMNGELEIVEFYENPVFTKNGDEKLIAWSTVLFKDNYGNITGLLSSGEDITERKKAEKQLKESEEKYKNLSVELETILDIIPGMVFCKNKDDIVTRVNQIFADSLRLKKEDIIGKTTFDFFPLEQAKKFRNDDLEVITSGKPKLNIEESGDFPDGKMFVITSKVPQYNDKGEILGTIGLTIDITKQKIAEQKLRESEEKYRNIFEKSSNAIVLLDFTGKIIECNSATETIFGYSKDDLIGQNYLQLPFYTESMIKVLKERFQAITKKSGLKTQELEIKKKYGNIARIKTNISYVKIGGQNFFQAIIQDITEQKNAEEKLRKSEEKYREAFERAELYKDLFAHDISNILQNVKSSLGLLSMWRNNPEKLNNIDEVMSIINDSIVRGSKLVSNIRTLSKISETGGLLKNLELIQILKEAIKFIRKSFPGKNLNIEIDSKIDGAFVEANELLMDVFENILFNAVKYNKSLKIEIITRLSKIVKDGINYVKVEFIDNGIGVPDVMKENIFKGRSTRTEKAHGMGLGLLLVKKVIENYNGQIWVEDRIKEDPSNGSNFIILIPEAI